MSFKDLEIIEITEGMNLEEIRIEPWGLPKVKDKQEGSSNKLETELFNARTKDASRS